MLDIKQEIEILLLKKRLSMRKIVALMKEAGYDIPQQSTVSTAFNNKRIRFENVQEILEFLGYELRIHEKQK